LERTAICLCKTSDLYEIDEVAFDIMDLMVPLLNYGTAELLDNLEDDLSFVEIDELIPILTKMQSMQLAYELGDRSEKRKIPLSNDLKIFKFLGKADSPEVRQRVDGVERVI